MTTTDAPGSWWLDDADRARDPRPAELPASCEVLVVGAGVVGLAAARSIARAGDDVVVVDAEPRVGAGVSGQSTAKVTVGTGLRLDQVAASSGDSAAREYASAGLEGLSTAREVLARHPWVRHQVTPHRLYATRTEVVGDLEAHRRLAMGSGLDVRSDDPPYPFALSALAYDDQLVVQPVELLQALAADVLEAGGAVVLGTTVTDVAPEAGGVRVTTSSGDVLARRVVLATHVPVNDSGRTFLHWRQQRHHALVGVAPGQVPTSYDVGDGWSTRPALSGDGVSRAIVVGMGHDVGDGSDRRSAARLADWATSRLSMSVERTWATQDAMSLDGAPIVGVLGSDDVLTATGLSAWGWAHGFAAGEELSRRVRGLGPRWRSWDLQTATRLSRGPKAHLGNVGAVARDALLDHVRALGRSDDRPLSPGEGRVVREGTSFVAECVTSDGQSHRVSARCTHLGCLVRWDAGAESWDCPCHQSRFAADGSVLHGPATSGLEKR